VQAGLQIDDNAMWFDAGVDRNLAAAVAAVSQTYWLHSEPLNEVCSTAREAEI
jgi:hypothetical protein